MYNIRRGEDREEMRAGGEINALTVNGCDLQ